MYLNFALQAFGILQSVRLHAQWSRATVKALRPFNWTAVLVPVYKWWGRIDLLSVCATVGGDVPRSAGCYRTFFLLAKQATNKLASSELIPCRTLKTRTTLPRCRLHIYSLLLVQIRCTYAFSPWEPSIMLRLFRSVQVRLRCKHAGVIDLQSVYLGVLARLWEIRFSMISVRLTCLHAF